MISTKLRRLVFAIPAIALAFPGLSSHTALANAGDADTTFGSGGHVATAFTHNDTAKCVAVQSDGKIVVAGYAATDAGFAFATARYLPDGWLDTSFHGNGKVVTPISNGKDFPGSVLIQRDGRIIVVGSSNDEKDSAAALVRYTADGALDTSFHQTGIVTVRIGETNGVVAHGALQEDGRIVVAGCADGKEDRDLALLRFTPDGELDSTFHGTGKVISPLGSNSNSGFGLALQPDAKIVVAASAMVKGQEDIALLRFNGDGSPDQTFNHTGMVTTHLILPEDYGHNDAHASAVAVQRDGKIVLTAQLGNGIATEIAALRYLPDGALDKTFHGTGSVIFGEFKRSMGRCIALQSDGRILVGGAAMAMHPGGPVPVTADFVLQRINANGVVDPTFHAATQTVKDAYSFGAGLAVQNDGRILMVGSFDAGEGPQFLVMRFQSAP